MSLSASLFRFYVFAIELFWFLCLATLLKSRKIYHLMFLIPLAHADFFSFFFFKIITLICLYLWLMIFHMKILENENLNWWNLMNVLVLPLKSILISWSKKMCCVAGTLRMYCIRSKGECFFFCFFEELLLYFIHFLRSFDIFAAGIQCFFLFKFWSVSGFSNVR